MNYQTQCPHCYEWFFGSHICKVLNPSVFERLPPANKTHLNRPLTEDDVRRIVHEELAKATKEQP